MSILQVNDDDLWRSEDAEPSQNHAEDGSASSEMVLQRMQNHPLHFPPGTAGSISQSSVSSMLVLKALPLSSCFLKALDQMDKYVK